MRSVSRHIPLDHPAFAGHFPGQPVLPGVVLLAEVLEALLTDGETGPRLSHGCRVGAAKFLSAVTPGADIRIQWHTTAARVQFEVCRPDASGEVLAASGHFETIVRP